MEIELVHRVVHLHNQLLIPTYHPSPLLIFNMLSADDIRMAELCEEMACLERKVAEEARRAEEERIVREAEEARLAMLEEEKRIAEEERKRKEEEERRQAEEQRQVAIALAEYQRNAEKAEADRAEVEKIEAAKATFKKHEDADVTFCKATAKVQWELKAKARKEAAAAKRSESEKAEGSGK